MRSRSIGVGVSVKNWRARSLKRIFRLCKHRRGTRQSGNLLQIRCRQKQNCRQNKKLSKSNIIWRVFANLKRDDMRIPKQLENPLRKAVRVLEKNKIRYAIIGGIALAQWGAGRATLDVDFKLTSWTCDTSVNGSANLPSCWKSAI